MSILRTTLALAALASAACASRPAPLRIAAAADLQYALADIAKAFHQRHPGVRVEPVYGSSGLFYAQLINHAPFDLFLSADVEYPRKLAQQGLILTGSEFTYAEGRIVLWAGNTSGLNVRRIGLDALRLPALRHIAIANPAHAPYGRAAEAALRSFGLYDAVKDKLVLGENVSQAFQLANSGAAEAAIVPLSLALAPPATRGAYWEFPSGAYPRIQQGGAIMRWTANPLAAQGFRAFLLAPEGRVILKQYGFEDR